MEDPSDYIIGKIYVEKEGIIAFDSCKEEIKYHLILGRRSKDGPFYDSLTTVKPTSMVVISQEAIDLITSQFRANDSRVVMKGNGDYEFLYMDIAREGDRGIISYRPQYDKTIGFMDFHQEIRVATRNGYSLSCLREMMIAPNEVIRNLDLSKPIKKDEIEQTADPSLA